VLLVLLRIWMVMFLGIREASFRKARPNSIALEKGNLGTHMRAIRVQSLKARWLRFFSPSFSLLLVYRNVSQLSRDKTLLPNLSKGWQKCVYGRISIGSLSVPKYRTDPSRRYGPAIVTPVSLNLFQLIRHSFASPGASLKPDKTCRKPQPFVK
jgi:hypothetical protein